MHSGFAAYFYECLGGIRPSKPGYKEFTLQPLFPPTITYTNVAITTLYGEIINHWKITEKGRLEIKLIVPFNTHAKLILRPSERASLVINGEEWKGSIQRELGQEQVLLGAGEYLISYDKAF